MELAPAADGPPVRRIGVFHPQGHIGEQFLLEAIADLAAGHKLPFLAGEGGVVDHKGHLQGGFIHLDQGQGFGVIGTGDGLADVDLIKSSHGH